MIKVAYFKAETIFFKPKHVAALRGQDFFDYSAATNFITAIEEKNVISISYFCRGTGTPVCAITYHDNELLTCPSCGREISDSFDFCPKCGVKLK